MKRILLFLFCFVPIQAMEQEGDAQELSERGYQRSEMLTDEVLMELKILNERVIKNVSLARDIRASQNDFVLEMCSLIEILGRQLSNHINFINESNEQTDEAIEGIYASLAMMRLAGGIESLEKVSKRIERASRKIKDASKFEEGDVAQELARVKGEMDRFKSDLKKMKKNMRAYKRLASNHK